MALGVYPHLNIIDASFSWLMAGRQVNLHASRGLQMEMDTAVGPIRIDVVEPLRVLRVTVDAADEGIRAELTFTGRAFPLAEPRFTRRNGPRVLMDVTRLTQNGSYAGWIEVDGACVGVRGPVLPPGERRFAQPRAVFTPLAAADAPLAGLKVLDLG